MSRAPCSVTVVGFFVITSSIVVSAGSRRSASTRVTRSRSVTIPIGTVLLVDDDHRPDVALRMRSATVWTVSPAVAVSTCGRWTVFSFVVVMACLLRIAASFQSATGPGARDHAASRAHWNGGPDARDDARHCGNPRSVARRERLRRLPADPLRGPLERFDGARLVEVEDRVELSRQQHSK